MPLTVPGGLLTKANFIVAILKPLVDSTEATANAAQTDASAALALGGQKATAPVGADQLASTVKALAVKVETGTGYTLVVGDAYNVLVQRSNVAANTITVPPDSTANLPIGSVVTVTQTGVGTTTVTPGAGVTLRWNAGTPGTGGKALAGQYAKATLTKVAANTWDLDGALAA